jgi:type III pantothenate kinase
MGPDSAHILAIDAGNTRIKWGVFDGAKWNPCGALPTAEAARLHDVWNSVPADALAFASNVAGIEVQGHIERACAKGGWPLAITGPSAIGLGVTNGYRDHRQLGSDRWAALIAAHHGHRGHKLVVNAGTALTVDALLADGHFLGGLIVPGPALMRQSLDRGTAGLRSIEGRFDAFPTRTQDAITTGAIQACAGAIERMRQAMAGGGCEPGLAILSGGAAAELAPHLSLELVVNENLVLDGLLLIARNA